ncbi:thioredoxin family protein [Fodinibius saliphilus]|uniref:thioredoxin family protein n=1 Tax=Fodinibius saliphilus TaxID=1920650 RepID=UPI001BB1D6A6|nr:thioredoxin family protein [Fodinibius saliphilus]
MSKVSEQVITSKVIEQAMSYKEYRRMIGELLAEDKTTGSDHSEDMIHYTTMNVHRMTRLDKRVTLTDKIKNQLQQLDSKLVWLVLTEAWCGDAAQNIPVIAKIANASDKIELELILRDEHPEIMDQFLTNGGRAIPKLICLDAESLDEKGSWGPRPEEAQKKVRNWIDNTELSKEEWARELHKWYAKDRGKELQSEFVELLKDWK